MMGRNGTANLPRRAWAFASLLAIVTLLCGGCSGWSLPGDMQEIDVKATYAGLENKRVAVVMSLSDYAESHHRTAREKMTKEITRRIVVGVPSSTVIDPDEVLRWQENNPYWGTRPPSVLLRQLKVDCLILIEVGEYRLHEPGNKHQLRGVIVARVNIAEAQSPDPDNFVASYETAVMYPETSVTKIGRISESEQKVEQMTRLRFCEEAAGLFYDHKIYR